MTWAKENQISFDTFSDVQKVKVGTYEEVLGKGATPPWARPEDVMKYKQDNVIERESGYVLKYDVSFFKGRLYMLRGQT